MATAEHLAETCSLALEANRDARSGSTDRSSAGSTTWSHGSSARTGRRTRSGVASLDPAIVDQLAENFDGSTSSVGAAPGTRRRGRSHPVRRCVALLAPHLAFEIIEPASSVYEPSQDHLARLTQERGRARPRHEHDLAGRHVFSVRSLTFRSHRATRTDRDLARPMRPNSVTGGSNTAHRVPWARSYGSGLAVAVVTRERRRIRRARRARATTAGTTPRRKPRNSTRMAMP